MKFSLANQLAYEIRSVLRGYPGFVFSNGASVLKGHVPVFVYHTIEPARFERDLLFLVENGYRSLGIAELVACLEHRQPADKSVVLTFDDARSSFWRYGFPLLQRYGMKGVLYAIPGLTPDAAAVRDNLCAAWEGRCGTDAIARADPNDETLCTWPELRRMYQSGCVDIESHSLFHREVFIGTDVVDVVGPGTSFIPYQTPVTAYLSSADVGRTITPEAYYGLPLFRAAPLHMALPAREPSPDLRDHAHRLWSELRESERTTGAYRGRLRARWKTVDVSRSLRRQTEADVERNLTEDVVLARDLIKARIDRDAGDHFCLPYAVGSVSTLRVLKNVGVKSCAWGVIPGKTHNAPGDEPSRICRIKADFLWRLPGAGRKSLLQIYGGKVEHRVRGERVY